MKKNRKRTKIENNSNNIIIVYHSLFIHCFNLFFTIDIHNSIIAKIKLFVKRDVVMNQTVDLPIRYDRNLL